MDTREIIEKHMADLLDSIEIMTDQEGDKRVTGYFSRPPPPRIPRVK